MNNTNLKKSFFTLVLVLLAVLASSPVFAADKYFAAWFGTSNVDDYNTSVANGTGGTVARSGLLTTNTTANPTNIDTSSGSGNTTITVTPTAGSYKIKSIKWYDAGTNASWNAPASVNDWTTVAVSDPAVAKQFTINRQDNHHYMIWVVFEPASSTASISIDLGSNGAMNYGTTALTDNQSLSVSKNTAVTFTITPDPGYVVDYIKISNNSNSGSDVTLHPSDSTLSWFTWTTGMATATFNTGTTNFTFKIRFKQAPQQEVQVKWGTNSSNFDNKTGGYVDPPGSGNSGDKRDFSQNASPIFTIVPAANYTVGAVQIRPNNGSWSTVTVTNNTFTFNVLTTDWDVKVEFIGTTTKNVNVRWGSNAVGSTMNGLGGYVTPPGSNANSDTDVAVAQNTTQVFTITPNQSYSISVVQLCDSNGNNCSDLVVSGSNTVSVDVGTSNKRLYVYFTGSALNNVKVQWGTNGGMDDGLGGYVDPPGDTFSGSFVSAAQNLTKTFRVYFNTGYTIQQVLRSKNGNNFKDKTSDLICVLGNNYCDYPLPIGNDTFVVKVLYRQDVTTGVKVQWGTDSLATNGVGGYVDPPSDHVSGSTVNVPANTRNYDFKIYPAANNHILSVTLVNLLNDTRSDQTQNIVPNNPSSPTYYTFTLRDSQDHGWMLQVVFEPDSNNYILTTSVVTPDSISVPPADCVVVAPATPPTYCSQQNGTLDPPAASLGGTTSVPKNTFKTVTFTPDSGYVVGDVFLDTVSMGAVASLDVLMDKGHLVEVYFLPRGYDITATAGLGGSVSPGLGENTTQTKNYAKNSDQTFTITPSPGYRILDVVITENGVTASKGAITSFTFKNLLANGVISATFASATVSTCTYCQTPAFIASGTTLLPNVLIIFDTSGSMGNSAYSSATHDWSKNYYGYFDSTKVYKLSGGIYSIDTTKAPPTAADKNTMSGNYLNWKYMDRVDVIRRVLIGGKVEDNAGTLTNRKTATATKYLIANSGVKIDAGKTEPTGILQSLYGRVRFGIMTFGSYDSSGKLVSGLGGHIVADMESTLDNLVITVQEKTDPGGVTPLAESLYEAVRFFKGTTSAYNYNVNYASMDPVQWSCQKHFVLMVTDGLPNESAILPGRTNATNPVKLDTHFNAETWYSLIPDPGTGESSQKSYISAVAYYAHNTDLRSGASGTMGAEKDGTQNLTVYGIYSFGSAGGSQALKSAAKYGGYDDKDADGVPDGTCVNAAAPEWCQGGDGIPDNYFEAEDGDTLVGSIMNAMTSILAEVSSGTAASILSNSEGSGANLLQAVFYPNKIFANGTQVDWIGEMQNLWYYVDPFIDASTVREDTDFSGSTAADVKQNHILELKKDYAARFYFDKTETLVELEEDTNGDGTGDVTKQLKENPDKVKSLWRAGKNLWAKSAVSRTIHTSKDGISLLYPDRSGGGFFNAITRRTELLPYLQAANDAEASKIIDYVRGVDQPGYRVRNVAYVNTPETVPATYTSNVWKLGDIISSTPRIQSSIKLNSYNVDHPVGYNDKSYGAFIAKDAYKNRGMVYVGANDGMLHAFKLGKLTVSGTSDVPGAIADTYLKIAGDVKSTLTGTNLGEEQWAYIPRNALPYLKYLSDRDNYKHLYYVDGSTTLADVSVEKPAGCSSDYWDCTKDSTNGTNWKTVLIGSMGLGGATRIKGNSCSEGIKTGICVKTPIFDPADNTNSTGLGYSSYFALDITNQYFDATNGNLAGQPSLKWEFSHPDLGYSTSGAAIVRINAQKAVTNAMGTVIGYTSDPNKNGRWFAVFASGPTGPIDGNERQFYGKSDQTLKIFVVDINATPPFVQNTNYWIIDTGIPNAFGGTITSAAIDTDRWDRTSAGNYQDDALYIGYTKARIAALSGVLNPETDTWTDGGVIRILTNDYKVNSASQKDMTPASWTWSKVIEGNGSDNIGPITSGIAKLQDRKHKKLWLFFGSGRFFSGADDKSSQRRIYGVQDSCYTMTNELNKDCSTTVLTLADLNNQSTGSIDPTITEKGWYINLGAEDVSTQMGAERAITEPVAMTNGSVFYTTFKPTANVCNFGGDSFLWGVNYGTGGELPAAAKTGKILVQVSTGAFEEIAVKDALTAEGNRRLGTPMTGKPPADPPPVISNASNKPPKKILHLQEK